MFLHLDKRIIGYVWLLFIFLLVPSSTLAQTYVDWDVTVTRVTQTENSPGVDVDLSFLHKPSGFTAQAQFRGVDPTNVKGLARDQITRYERVFSAKSAFSGKISISPDSLTATQIEEADYARDVVIWRNRKAALDAGMPENAIAINTLFNDLKTRYRVGYAYLFR